MLMWAFGLFVAALLAAAVGFTEAFKDVWGIVTAARVLCFILLILFVLTFLTAIF